jgi:hypothetical protein
MEEVNIWLEDRNSPLLFLEPIVEHAYPLIVHTVTQQVLLKTRYGVEAHVATCCPTAFFEEEELTTFAKQAVRERYRIPSPVFLLSSFGPVSGWNTCILAVELLRSWNIPAELYFIGDARPAKREIDQISAVYGISEHVHSGPELATNKAYRDFLLASDAAIQLRSYEFGQISTPLADCISAGLPGVATSDLAKSCGAPEYVSTVPDQFSPLQVAEQLALIWEARTERPSYADARAAYLEKHNFEYYGKRLIEILGIA